MEGYKYPICFLANEEKQIIDLGMVYISKM